jgi:hypothetical protein
VDKNPLTSPVSFQVQSWKTEPVSTCGGINRDFPKITENHLGWHGKLPKKDSGWNRWTMLTKERQEVVAIDMAHSSTG